MSDVSSEVIEELDFSGGRVVEMSLAFGYLVAATHNQVKSCGCQTQRYLRGVPFARKKVLQDALCTDTKEVSIKKAIVAM